MQTIYINGLEPFRKALIWELFMGYTENKNYIDLKGDVYYQKWIDSEGKLPFPNGENMNSFSKRCVSAFDKAVKKYSFAEKIAFIVHGGTIMSIAEHYLGGEFYDYHLKNGEYMIISL